MVKVANLLQKRTKENLSYHFKEVYFNDEVSRILMEGKLIYAERILDTGKGRTSD